ncbi:MAG: BTAD domain-containing putative transcriptional regulator [Syntrophobacter sp.]
MLELLSTVPLFASLGKREIHFLADMVKTVDYPENTVLFREGEIGNHLYIVVEGRLDILRGLGKPEEHLIRVAGPGEHIGEMCFLRQEGIRSATVRTRTAVRLLELSRDDLEALMARRPSIAVAIARGLTNRMLDAENRLLDILNGQDRLTAGTGDSGGQSESSAHQSRAQPPIGQEDAGERSRRSGIPRLRIKALGNFQVLRGETRIDESEWKAKQPKLLLKAILTRGGEGVPKDVLIDDLWPESTPDSGESSFKVVLHRLRKILEPSLQQSFGSSYISLKNNLVFLNRSLCHSDLDEFLVLQKKGRRAEETHDPERAVRFYQSALDLYSGDYLSEDLYVDWVEQRRTEMRTTYLDILSRVAELHMTKGRLKKAAECYQSIIKTDPTSEEAYQKLMLIYSTRGMPAKAAKMFETCKKALETELGVEPGQLTVSIYRRIIDTP